MLNAEITAGLPRTKWGRPSFLSSAAALLLILTAAGCYFDEEDRPGEPPTESAVDSTETNTLATDSWDGEAYQDRTAAQLRRILDVLARGATSSPDGEIDLASLLAENFATSPLRPEMALGQSATVTGGFEVRRWKKKHFAARQYVGAAGLRQAFDGLRARWPDDASPRLTAKQFEIQAEVDRVVVKVAIRVYAAGPRRAVQQQANWVCTWERVGPDDGEPRLLSIQVENLEEVETARPSGRPMLQDVTESLIGDLACYRDNLRYGANHWILRYPRLKHRFHHGLAVGDVNGDELEDVYLCQPEGMPNILLLREPDGSVREAAAEFGIDFLDNATSALLVDLDNDGDQDLVVAMRLIVVILENTGGRFEPRFSLPPSGQLFSLAAADYDEDGLLDLYVCRYMNFGPDGKAPNPIPLHDATNGGRNTLLRNLGGWRFEDVTGAVGLDHNNTRWSVAASWEDYDNDGDLDLYVANDYGRNCLYRCDRDRNGRVRFRDVAAQAGVEDMTTGMSVAWSDVNHDGRMDVYVSNMYSSAGRRVTYQKNFKKDVLGVDAEHVRAIRYTALGNSLFQNGPDGKFQHASEIAGVRRGLWAWSSNFVDLNNDGWEDLLVANGFLTGPNAAKDL